MDILEELGLGSGGVSAEEDVDLPSEPTPSALRKLLAHPAEQLTQDPFLHVLVLPNARSKGVHQLIIQKGIFREILELFDLGLSEELSMVVFEYLVLLIIFLVHFHIVVAFILLGLFSVHIVPLGVSLHKVDHINVGPVDVPHRPLHGVDPHANSLVHPHN